MPDTRTLRQQILRGGMGSMAVKLAGLVIGFLLTVVLARTLGPEGFGTYAFIMALVTLLAMPARAGVPALAVRETARAEAREEWGVMRGLWRWGNRFVAMFSAGMVLLTGAFLLFAGDLLSDARREALVFGIILIPLMALGALRGAQLRGLRHTVTGQFPEMILRPGLLLLLVLAVTYVAGADTTELSPGGAMGLHALAAVMAFAIGAAVLWWMRPAPLRAAPPPEYHRRAWVAAAIPLALLAGLQVINKQTDTLMLGVLQDDHAVGIYSVVFQIATLVIFGLQALNQVTQPHCARLYARGHMGRLQRLITLSARAILAIALPAVLVMVAFGAPLLELLFGAEYRAGATALAILALGQLVNAAMGPSGMVLNMTGHERDTLKGVGFAALVNVVLNLVLIPPFGIEGAATATAVTLITWNVILRAFVRKRLGLDTLPFGGRPYRP